MNRCGICETGWPLTHDGYVDCLRPEGHQGPHLVVNIEGELWCWAPDDESEDPEDYVAWEVSLDEARQLVRTTDPEGSGSSAQSKEATP